MSKRSYEGVVDARRRLPSLIDAAERGGATVITRRGRPVAALVPLDDYAPQRRQQPLLPLRGSGAGLWGSSSRSTLTRLRNEWDRSTPVRFLQAR